MTETYRRQLRLPVTAEEAFKWHSQPGALQRLIPPWESVQIVQSGDGIRDGSIVKLKHRLGPMNVTWVARHHDCRQGHSFRDTQLSGPFARWEHLHDFQETGQGCELTDLIEYEIPGGAIGRLLGSLTVRRKLSAMFTYRHKTTYDDLAAHARYHDEPAINVAVTGSSGLVGSTLIPLLTTGGHRVTRLVRSAAAASELEWNPQAETFDASLLDGIHAVVHLAGENIAAARWSSRVKEKIRNSRVHGTRVLCESLARMPSPPKVLVCASAVGFYGDRGSEILTEQYSAGTGFLAKVAQEWESATAPAREAGIRVVHLRFGMVLSPRAGALAKMLFPFKLGMGGRVGSGRQYWSWISIDDACGAILHALMTDSLQGPVNAVAPYPVTSGQFARTLGRLLGRPAIMPLPAAVARRALGEMASELLLASTRVAPQRLVNTGYEFRQPTLENGLCHLLGKAVESDPPDAEKGAKQPVQLQP